MYLVLRGTRYNRCYNTFFNEMSKEIQCDDCGAVVMKLAKGSQVKPNIYTIHESCPKSSKDSGRTYSPEAESGNLEHLKKMMGMS